MAVRRDRCKGQGKGKPVKGKPKDDPTVTTLRLPLDLTARLKCVRQAHPDRVASAVFSTEHFSITADCDTVAFRHEDVGKVFTIHVAVRSRVESTLQAFDGAVANQPAYLSVRSSVESHAGFPALHSLALVFHQREADKVLVVREWSNAAKMLRSRIEDFMLDDSYLLQRRFHVATGKLRRLFPGEALKDLKAADFSSHELSLLAKLSQPDAYQEWRDRALFSARHEVDFHRMREDQDVQAVLRALTTSQQVDATPKFYLPSEEHAATRVGGQDGERRLDMTATLRLCLLRHFVDKVALVPTCPSPTSRALSVESEDGKWKQVLFLVSVPERLAQSLRPSTRPAQWIPVSELHGALAESAFDAAGGVARLLEGQAAFQLEMGEPEEALKLRRRAVGA